MPIAASHGWDSPPNPYARRASAKSRKTASHTPSADAPAVARGVNHVANGATRCVQATSKAASSNRTVTTAVGTSISEVGTHTATVGNTAAAEACVTIYQATPAVTGDTTKAAVADGRPPTTGVPLLTPDVVLALETPPNQRPDRRN